MRRGRHILPDRRLVEHGDYPITGQPGKFLIAADWTEIVETEFFAQNLRESRIGEGSLKGCLRIKEQAA